VKVTSKQLKEKQGIVDELGALDSELARLKPKIDRAKYLRDVIVSWYADEKPEAAMLAEGTQYSAVVSAMGNKRSVISIKDVKRRLGETEFMQHCSIGLGVLDEILSVEELPEFVKTERTGPRSVKTVPRA
jgi:RNA processing factor Prp31